MFFFGFFFRFAALCDQLKSKNIFSVQTVFSHLAASEDPAEDAFLSGRRYLVDGLFATYYSS